MKKYDIDYVSLNQDQYENSEYKNSQIALGNSEYICYFDESATTENEIDDIIQNFDIPDTLGAIVFGTGIEDGFIEFIYAITNPQIKLFALVVRRKIFNITGCFNIKSSGASNYDFLCRLCAVTDVYGVLCDGDSVGRTDDEMLTDATAYVLRKYVVELKEIGKLEYCLSAVMGFCDRIGYSELLMKKLNQYMSEEDTFYNRDEDTAPFLIITGDNTCYGVLYDFAISLAHALARNGEAVVTTDGTYGSKTDIAEILKHNLKGAIGFQSPALTKDYFKKIKAKKIQFWFDHPAYFQELFDKLPEDYCILCQDGDYAKFVREMYGVKRAFHFPPAGNKVWDYNDIEREYDIVFIGSFNPQKELTDEFQREFYEYMIKHSSETFEEGLRKVLLQKNITITDEQFVQLLFSLKETNRCVCNYYRKKVLETLLGKGYKVMVFGETWDNYDGIGADKLIRKDAVTPDEALSVLQKSKIGLNVMTWHKDGMTERIANIMLSGAVCLTDESRYLKENFTSGIDIELFNLNELEKLPKIVEKLLSDDEYRKKISYAGYEKAVKYHTWNDRAEKIIKMTME